MRTFAGHPSVLLHCWLGHLTCKIVSEMTYNVSSGMLNPTITCHTFAGRPQCFEFALTLLLEASAC